jgi:hypothetical protein
MDVQPHQPCAPVRNRQHGVDGSKVAASARSETPTVISSKRLQLAGLFDGLAHHAFECPLERLEDGDAGFCAAPISRSANPCKRIWMMAATRRSRSIRPALVIVALRPIP